MLKIAQILIPPLNDSYSYAIPDYLEIEAGYVVEVALGKKKRTGYVISCNQESEEELAERKYKIKSVESDSHFAKLFTLEQLDFFRWIANYYVVPLSQVLHVALPKALPKIFEKFISFNSSQVNHNHQLTTKQEKILNYLKEKEQKVSTTELNKMFKGASITVKALIEKDLLIYEELEKANHHLHQDLLASWTKPNVKLNELQTSACEKISKSIKNQEFKGFLIHGVTGSGKTEIYIEAMQAAIEAERTVILVVPEIALTPQVIQRLRARLGNNIVILHSGLSPRARWDGWCALLNGTSKIVIGARSAIFAPLKNVGLIIVDEEHDSSFKQSDGLRYNGRDLAVVRANLEKCPVVLGSATPALESFANTIKGRYELISLSQQHSIGEKQAVQIVNLNLIKPWEMPSPNISAELFYEIEKVIEKKQQAFILYNRRGFASYFQCQRCKSVLRCKQCDVTLTYHQKNNALVCHYCNLSLITPKYCQECEDYKDSDVEPLYSLKGSGTEKVTSELEKLFPQARIKRLDRDTVDEYDGTAHELFEEMREENIDILVGTQMIAKGHDLPLVTLVGVVDCDVGLNMPDFRAAEKVFQLLTQAAGRAGRTGLASKVIFQTRAPQHQSLLCAQTKNYMLFAKQELTNRQQHLYPPFAKLLRVIIRSQDPIEAQTLAAQVKELICLIVNQQKLQTSVLGPSPTPIAKVKAYWRWHIIIKSKKLSDLHQIMLRLQDFKLKQKTAHIAFDLDPQDMM
jgi:primosomal protein N' (replication factor Y)